MNKFNLLSTALLAIFSLNARADVVEDTSIVEEPAAAPALEFKDLIPEQRVIAEVLPTRPRDPKNPGVRIWLDHRNNVYHIGEEAEISVKAERSGYLHIISVGTSGRVIRLFPNKYESNNYVRKGQIIKIPGKSYDYIYKVHGPAGLELLKAFITDSNAPIWGKSAETFSDDIFPVSSSTPELIAKDLMIEEKKPEHRNMDTFEKVFEIRP